MGELVVVVFGNELRAEEVRLDLLRMEHKHLADLEDAVILVRNKDGKIKLRHDSHLSAGGALAGGLLGGLVGLMLLNPVFIALGLGAGAIMGGVSGSMMHLGISEEFMKTLAEHLKPGTSVLCILVRESLEKVLNELENFEGRTIHTSITEGYERKLQEMLNGLQANTNA